LLGLDKNSSLVENPAVIYLEYQILEMEYTVEMTRMPAHYIMFFLN
jgi:hypothetical protein